MSKLFKHQKITEGLNIDKFEFWNCIIMFNQTNISLEEFENILKKNNLNINDIKEFDYLNSNKYIYIYKNIPIKIDILNNPEEIIYKLLKIINSNDIYDYIPTFLIKDFLTNSNIDNIETGQMLINKMNNDTNLYPAHNTKDLFEKYYKNNELIKKESCKKITIYKYINNLKSIKEENHCWFLKSDYPMINNKNDNYLLEATINEKDIIAKFTDSKLIYINENNLKSIKKIKPKYHT